MDLETEIEENGKATMATTNELRRLAMMGNALRPDWSPQSLYAFLEKDQRHRPFGDLAIALTAIAVDEKTVTPKRLNENGYWWRAAQVRPGATVAAVSRPECPRHPGERGPGCPACAVEAAPPPVAELRAGLRPRSRSVDPGTGQSLPMPPPGMPTSSCWCGGTFLDSPAGRDAHEAVFSHRPETGADDSGKVKTS